MSDTDSEREAKIGDFEGPRISINVDVNFLRALGGGIGWAIAPVNGWDSGIFVISRSYSYGLGIEGLRVNGNLNFGETTYEKQ